MEKLSCLLALLVLSLKVATCVLDALMSKAGLEAHCWGRGEGIILENGSSNTL